MPKNSHFSFLFVDETDAARQLIEALPSAPFAQHDTVVVAASAYGVGIARQVAEHLDAPMDVLISEPIGAPHNPAQPIAMISETQTLVIHKALVDAFEIDEASIYRQAQVCYDEQVLSMRQALRHGEPILPVAHKAVVLVDACAETGLTMRTAIKSMLQMQAANVYLAVPVMDEAVYDNLIQVCDDIYTPHVIRDYITIDYYYQTLPEPIPQTTPLRKDTPLS